MSECVNKFVSVFVSMPTCACVRLRALGCGSAQSQSKLSKDRGAARPDGCGSQY